MFQSSGRLPHLLSPEFYHSAEHYRRELDVLFVPGWTVVGTLDDLARDGDFITCELYGQPIHVRNFAGEIRAVSNVCAHRHCLITSIAKGNSPKLRCQYHGWEYDCHGRTGRIPEPKNFVPFDREAMRLPQYRLELCGQLVFVSLDTEAMPLSEFLGPWHAVCAERFGAGWRPYLIWNPDYSANWKVPVENSLEAYHVPCIHPNTFREDPGESRSSHSFETRSTAFRTQLPFSAHSQLDAWFQRCEGRVLGWLGVEPTRAYRQTHVFPHCLFSFTDTISLCHQVIPTSATTSRAVVRQFSRCDRAWPSWRRALGSGWGRLAAAITKSILLEDNALYADIHRGLAASPHAGVLGRCEERIHAFQHYVREACLEGSMAAAEQRLVADRAPAAPRPPQPAEA